MSGSPDERRRFLDWSRLRDDLLAASAHAHELYVFSLEGCVEHDLLTKIRDLDWSADAAATSVRATLAARRSRFWTRQVLRAEPIFDWLLPSRRES